MSQPFLGQINIFPYNFAPRGWAFCQGQIMSIAQNTALFSLLGTTFGGNGQTTFALPDLRGRFANSSGQGPGLSDYDLGQVGGTESVTININQMPAHAHPFTVPANNGESGVAKPSGAFLGKSDQSIYSATAGAQMGPGTTAIAGGSQPTPTMPPYLTLNFCIATEGIYPSRN
jgi:microcystin-dependent protein